MQSSVSLQPHQLQPPPLTRGNGLIRCKKCQHQKGTGAFSYRDALGWHVGAICKTCRNTTSKG